MESADVYWLIKVVDEGVGISSENQEKNVQVGANFKTECTEGEKGTGLGLIICKEFVNKNGGEMTVISEEGKRSTFSFTMPKS